MKSKKRNDVFLIFFLLIVIIILGLLFQATQLEDPENGIAVVTIDGEEYGRYPLNKDIKKTIKLSNDSFNIIEIEDGEVDITAASCPDKICVDHRKVSRKNESIVCLPNKMIVSIENGVEAEVDSSTN